MAKRKKDFSDQTIIIGAIVLLFCSFSLIFFFPKQISSSLSNIKNASNQLASVIIRHNFRLVSDIRQNYQADDKKVKIVIVPGHEPNYGGAEYLNLKEREMNLELGLELQKLLEADFHYEVFITRDTNGWTPTFERYFINNYEEINEWIEASHQEFSELVQAGIVSKTYSTVMHNSARADVANRLYGITKWSNEHDVDIVIHIHFNDNHRKNLNGPGKYSGFSIYVPASQYGNNESTKAIANSISNQLAKYNPISDLPGETNGVIDEPELIAVGSNNTADSASLLIEYGYIYEPQFQSNAVRSLAIKDLAFQTYLGLQDFFGDKENNTTELNETVVLPCNWQWPDIETMAPLDVFALQTALMVEGVYPPPSKSKNDCPRTGIIGECTKESLKIFQAKHGLVETENILDLKILEKIN